MYRKSSIQFSPIIDCWLRCMGSKASKSRKRRWWKRRRGQPKNRFRLVWCIFSYVSRRSCLDTLRSYFQELPAPTVDLRVVRPPKADIQNKENKTCSVCQVDFFLLKETQSRGGLKHLSFFLRLSSMRERLSLSTARLWFKKKRWHSHPQNEIWDAKLHLKYTRVCLISLQKKKIFFQVVHGMKFKTKSGISIPPPAIVKQDGMST